MDTIFGEDYGELKLPKGWSGQEQTELIRQLQQVTISSSDFINRSAARKNENIPLLLPVSDEIHIPRWNGIAGNFRLTYSYKHKNYDITVKLRSRFDQGSQNYFLCTMILSWLKKNGILFDEAQTGTGMEDIFRFVWVSVFKQLLERAFASGIYKTYQLFEENSNRIRGQIDFSRHIRMNMGMSNGRIASKFRENTSDNFMNHLILLTYLELKRVLPGAVASIIEGDEHSRHILDQLRQYAPSYSRYDIHTVCAKMMNPISHPFFTDYEDLRKVCLKILSYTGMSLFGKQSIAEGNSMLFYLPDLWEIYLEQRVLGRIRQHAWTCSSQVKSEDFCGIIKKIPDFVLEKKTREIEKHVVLDAKYRPQWASFSREKEYTTQDELYENILQCLIYKELLQAEATGVLFPAMGKGIYQRRPISAYDRKNANGGAFHAVGIGIPPATDAMTFRQWREKMSAEEISAARHVAALLREAET